MWWIWRIALVSTIITVLVVSALSGAFTKGNVEGGTAQKGNITRVKTAKGYRYRTESVDYSLADYDAFDEPIDDFDSARATSDIVGKFEGRVIHRNPTESDITAMYGIFRSAHPDAEIFKAIDEVAYKIGLDRRSRAWTDDDINSVNIYISQMHQERRFEVLATAFYKDYLQDAHIELYPNHVKETAVALFTNSPKHFVTALQSALNQYNAMGGNEVEQINIDGALGDSTQEALAQLRSETLSSVTQQRLFKGMLLLHMSQQYAMIVAKNPRKFTRFLIGWERKLIMLNNG